MNWQFWLFIVTPVVSVAFLLKTAASPFVWLIWLGVHGEALRTQFIKSAALAIRDFASSYRETVRQVRAERVQEAA